MLYAKLILKIKLVTLQRVYGIFSGLTTPIMSIWEYKDLTERLLHRQMSNYVA
jgi:hypothetical protein